MLRRRCLGRSKPLCKVVGERVRVDIRSFRVVSLGIVFNEMCLKTRQLRAPVSRFNQAANIPGREYGLEGGVAEWV